MSINKGSLLFFVDKPEVYDDLIAKRKQNPLTKIRVRSK